MYYIIYGQPLICIWLASIEKALKPIYPKKSDADLQPSIGPLEMQRKCTPSSPHPTPTSQTLTHWCSAHYLCNSLLSLIYNPNLRENITFCTRFCLLFPDPWVILSIVWKSIEIITFYWGDPNEESHMLAVLVSLSSICTCLLLEKNVKEFKFKVDP